MKQEIREKLERNVEDNLDFMYNMPASDVGSEKHAKVAAQTDAMVQRLQAEEEAERKAEENVRKSEEEAEERARRDEERQFERKEEKRRFWAGLITGVLGILVPVGAAYAVDKASMRQVEKMAEENRRYESEGMTYSPSSKENLNDAKKNKPGRRTRMK